jgi:hypothetical protein
MIYSTWVFHLLYTLQVALVFSVYNVSFCYWVYFSIKNTGTSNMFAYEKPLFAFEESL